MNLVFEQQLSEVSHTIIPGGLATAELTHEAKGRVSVRSLEVDSLISFILPLNLGCPAEPDDEHPSRLRRADRACSQ